MDESANIKPIWLTLSAQIDPTVVRNLINAIGAAIGQGFTHAHLLIHSPGGAIDDGIAAANFLRGCPLEVTTYNTGNVGSSAVFLYISGVRRVVEPSARFLLHRPYCQPLQVPTAALLSQAAAARDLDDERINVLFGQTQPALKLTPDFFTRYESTDVLVGAADAIDMGIATMLGSFSPPPSAFIHSLFP